MRGEERPFTKYLAVANRMAEVVNDSAPYFKATSSARWVSRGFTDASQSQDLSNPTQADSTQLFRLSSTGMPGRSRKRKSTDRVYETVPNLKQSRIGPSPHRTIRDKHPTWSAPNMRQQSITQMDALRGYYHPDLGNENLNTDDEEEDNYVASPTRNKRRKVTPEKPQARRIETRSAKRQAAKEEPSVYKQLNQHVLPCAGEEVKAEKLRADMPTAMLFPKTPMSMRRKEIPSSQSPADTPLSTQGRHSLQDYMRSPLKEKSTNIDLSIKTPIKGIRWSKRLEVADSMGSDDENSSASVKLGLMTKSVGPTVEPEDMTEEKLQISANASAIHVNDFNQRLEAAQRPVQEVQESSQARPRHEVIDSTDEEDDQEEAETFNAGPETQAALASTDVSQKSSDRPPESTPPTSKPTEDEPELGAIQRSASESPKPLKAVSPPTRKGEAQDQLSTQWRKKVNFVNLLNSDTPRPINLLHPSGGPSNSHGASAQLLSNLHRDTQPGGLQTESQFEKGWTTYTPADDIHSDLDPLPSSPKPVVITEHPSSALMTVPTQLIRPPISSPPTFYKAPVPPSQATTVDVTQPSPRDALSSSQAVVTVRSPRRKSPPPPSSPPPVPPSSGSLSAGRRLDPWEGYQWDGVRLTDSQLLPDSLLDDSEVGPPGFSQESWAEEA